MSSLVVSICGGSFDSSDNACDLRVILDSVLSFEAHINHVIKLSYYPLWNLAKDLYCCMLIQQRESERAL